MFTGIEINGSHSYKDFGLTIKSRNIGYPSKNKRKERVPFSNTHFDFSSLYGGQEYGERELEYTFNIIHEPYSGNFKNNFSNTQILETSIVNWLMSSNKKEKLFDDTIPGYYFLAEVEGGPSSAFEIIGSEFTITFTAYPFKIGDLEEGHDIWDEFNFLLDYAQITTYEINSRESITLYNNGASVVKPVIEASSEMEIEKNGKTFKIPKGKSESFDFALESLENKMTVIGNGTISFHFRKELI